VVVAETALPTDPDAIYVFDPAIVSDRGAIVLRPGKEGRLAETEAIAADLERAGVPVAVRLEAPASADGGDTMYFNVIFPRARTYRVWVQFQRKGVLNTVAFNIPVTELK